MVKISEAHLAQVAASGVTVVRAAPSRLAVISKSVAPVGAENPSETRASIRASGASRAISRRSSKGRDRCVFALNVDNDTFAVVINVARKFQTPGCVPDGGPETHPLHKAPDPKRFTHAHFD